MVRFRYRSTGTIFLLFITVSAEVSFIANLILVIGAIDIVLGKVDK